MEYWDLYDRMRHPIGLTHPRGRAYPMPDGSYHIVVMIFTVDENQRLLVTKRAHEKGMYPDFWEVTGGSAIAGEDSRTAALRELHEETGLDTDRERLTFLDTVTEPCGLVDIYLYRLPGSGRDVSLTLQKGETTDARFVCLHDFDRMVQTGSIPPPVAMRYGFVRKKLMACVGETAFLAPGERMPDHKDAGTSPVDPMAEERSLNREREGNA